MTKSIKTIIIATAIACAIMIGCACAMPACAEELPEFYPKLAIIISYEQCADVVCYNCMDKTGSVFSFYADASEEPWEIGDLCSLLMHRIDEIQEDDQIVDAFFEGWMAPDDFMELFGI